MRDPVPTPTGGTNDPGRGPTLMLVDLASPINIGMILRIAESFACPVTIVGSAVVLDDADKMRVVHDFACGALQRRGFERLAGVGAGGWRAGRRLLATTVEPDAPGLDGYRPTASDVVALGNEYGGLPDAVAAVADGALRIPMPDIRAPKPPSFSPIEPGRTAVARDGTPNLNVAMAAGIIAFHAYTCRRTSA